MKKIMEIIGFIISDEESIKFNSSVISYENGFFFGIMNDNNNQILYGKIDISGNFEMISVDFKEKVILEYTGKKSGKIYSGNVSQVTSFRNIEYGQFGFVKEEAKNNDLETINTFDNLKQCIIGPNDNLKAFSEEIKDKILSDKLIDSLGDNLFFKSFSIK